MQFITSAPSKSSGKGNGLAKLPEDQRKCVIAKFQASHEILVWNYACVKVSSEW